MFKVTARLMGKAAWQVWSLRAAVLPIPDRAGKGLNGALLENWGTWLPSPTAVDLGGGCAWQQCPGLILTRFSQSLPLTIKTS